MGASRAFAFLVRAEFRVCSEPCQGIFNQDAAAWERTAPFFHCGGESHGNSKRGGKLGLIKESRGVARQVAEFFFFFLGHWCVGWLEMDNIRGDGRAGVAVAFDVFGVG